jgi:hypothetical protein
MEGFGRTAGTAGPRWRAGEVRPAASRGEKEFPVEQSTELLRGRLTSRREAPLGAEIGWCGGGFQHRPARGRPGTGGRHKDTGRPLSLQGNWSEVPGSMASGCARELRGDCCGVEFHGRLKLAAPRGSAGSAGALQWRLKLQSVGRAARNPPSRRNPDGGRREG